jgi:hypothetical protein
MEFNNEYYKKYLKYKNKYIYLKKIIGGTHKYNSILSQIINDYKIYDEDKIYDENDIYDILGTLNINKKYRYNSINKDINTILNEYYKEEEIVLFTPLKI